jgi:hypothetical protein
MPAAIVAKRLVEHLERSGFVVMKKPPIGDGAAIGRGHPRTPALTRIRRFVVGKAGFVIFPDSQVVDF